MALAPLPLLTQDDALNITLIYQWLRDLREDFANASGEAIDPSVGEGGADALTVTDAPSGITYTSGTVLSVDGVLVGFIDITFTPPVRAADVTVLYRQEGQINFSRATAISSPFRLSNLSVGSTYELQLTGRAANNTIGPLSTLTEVSIATAQLDTDVPENVSAMGTFQTVVLTWDATTSGTLKHYEVERADDAAFTTNTVTWNVNANKFVDDTGVSGQTYYYRVRSVSTASVASDYSDTVSAATQSISAGDISVNVADHLHGISRWVADGVLSTFNLVDIAEYIEQVTHYELGDNKEYDPLSYTLSSGRHTLTFNAVPALGDILVAHYVIARL